MLEFDPVNHEYKLDGQILMSVTQIIKDAGLIEFSDKIRPEVLERASLRGREVHSACAFRASDDFDWGGVKPSVRGYVRAFDKFLAETNFKIESAELPRYHRIYKFAGTPDLTGFIGNRRIIIDLKTYEPAEWTGLQLSGYEELLENPAERWAVWLKEDGSYRLKEFKNPSDRDVFLSCLSVANWKNGRIK